MYLSSFYNELLNWLHPPDNLPRVREGCFWVPPKAFPSLGWTSNSPLLGVEHVVQHSSPWWLSPDFSVCLSPNVQPMQQDPNRCWQHISCSAVQSVLYFSSRTPTDSTVVWHLISHSLSQSFHFNNTTKPASEHLVSHGNHKQSHILIKQTHSRYIKNVTLIVTFFI